MKKQDIYHLLNCLILNNNKSRAIELLRLELWKWTSIDDRIIEWYIKKLSPTMIQLQWKSKELLICQDWKYNLDEIMMTKELRIKIDGIMSEYNNREKLNDIWMTPSNKIIMYWPPWNWKTTIAWWIAMKLWKPLLSVNLSTIVQSHLWETGRNLSQIFETASFEWAVLFLDEVDALGKVRPSWSQWAEAERANITISLLQLIDNMDEDIILLCATNVFNHLDPAFVRRFDNKIEIQNPNNDMVDEFVDHIIKKHWNYDISFNKTSCYWKSYSDIEKWLKILIKNHCLSL